MNDVLTIIPVFLGEEDSVWSSPQGDPLLRAFLEEFAPLNAQGGLAVFTDRSAVEAMAKDLGIDCHIIQVGANDEEPLPKGTRAAVRGLLRLKKGLGFERLAVLDFRNPFLNRSLLAQAAAGHDRQRFAVLASARKCRDHPCQFKRYYRNIEASGCVFLSAPQTGAPDRATGHSALMEVLARQDRTGSLDMVDGVPRLSAQARRQGLDLLKRLEADLAADFQAAQVVGAGVCPFAGLTAPVLAAIPGENGLRVVMPDEAFAFSETLDLKLVPLTSEGPRYSLGVELDIRRGAAFPLLSAPPADAVGYAYVLSSLAENDAFAFDDTFPHTKGLWLMDPVTGYIHTGKDGARITGRQETPDVLEIVPSLFIFNRGALGDLEGKGFLAGAQAWVLPDSRAITVRSLLDSLEYRARLKAENPW